MSKDPQPSRLQNASPAAKRILALGESGRYELKRDIDAVTPKLLAELANQVALNADLAMAHLVLGVDEIEDQETGSFTVSRAGCPQDSAAVGVVAER